MRVPLDQRGAASARVLPGTWLVSVFTSGGFSYQVVDVGVGGGLGVCSLDSLCIEVGRLRGGGASECPHQLRTRPYPRQVERALQNEAEAAAKEAAAEAPGGGRCP